MIERTLSIVKPDGTARNLTGRILARFEEEGLKPIAIRTIRLTTAQAKAFYDVHKERPFYQSLVKYMTSGPVVASVLEGENAIGKHREIMGATNPAEADEGTIRKLYAESLEANTVHGSDAPETAHREIAFFFTESELAQLDA